MMWSTTAVALFAFFTGFFAFVIGVGVGGEINHRHQHRQRSTAPLDGPDWQALHARSNALRKRAERLETMRRDPSRIRECHHEDPSCVFPNCNCNLMIGAYQHADRA